MDSFFHFWYFHLGQNMIRTYPTLPCGTPLFWISMVPFPSCIPVLWCSWPGCWARRSASCSWGFWSWSWGTAGSRRGKRRFLVGSGPTWAYHFVEALHGIIHGWTKTLKDHEGSSWIFKIMFSWSFFWRFCLICSSHLVLVWSAHIWSNHIEPIRNPIKWYPWGAVAYKMDQNGSCIMHYHAVSMFHQFHLFSIIFPFSLWFHQSYGCDRESLWK